MDKITIVYEDDQVLAVSKPAGVVVNRADTTSEETLQDWSETYLKISLKTNIGSNDSNIDALGKVFRERSGIAHRLDKETSGIMLIGKNPTSLALLMAQFKNRETKKQYLALVHGRLEPEYGIINLPLGRSPFNRQRFRVDVYGKNAITEYLVEEYFKVSNTTYQEGMTLVRLMPKTGRTHQIRVHMMHLGHSLVADELYGGRKRQEKDRMWCPRHFLHASKIGFYLPNYDSQVNNRKWLELEAPFTADLKVVLDLISNDQI